MGRTLFIICGAALALGLLAGVAPSPNERAEAQDRETRQQIADSLETLTAIAEASQKPAGTPEIEQSCEPSSERRTSDLCAQWKAADAAAESARWASWGLLISTVTVIALGITIWQGKQNLALAREIATAENRAWVKQDLKLSYLRYDNETVSIAGTVVTKNVGGSVAMYSFGSHGQLYLGDRYKRIAREFADRMLGEEVSSPLLPGDEQPNVLACAFKIPRQAKVRGREILPYLTVATVYETAGVRGMTVETFRIAFLLAGETAGQYFEDLNIAYGPQQIVAERIGSASWIT